MHDKTAWLQPHSKIIIHPIARGDACKEEDWMQNCTCGYLKKASTRTIRVDTELLKCLLEIHMLIT